MSLERLERTEQLLIEAIEAVEETKGANPEVVSLIRQATALVRELHDEANPAYPLTTGPASP